MRLIAITAALFVVATTMVAQLPIPTQQGQRGGTSPARGHGPRGQAAQSQDPPAVVSPIAAVSSEISGPGKFFETLMELKPGDDMAHFNYVTKEYFVSGTANGQPYKTRIVIRRP